MYRGLAAYSILKTQRLKASKWLTKTSSARITSFSVRIRAPPMSQWDTTYVTPFVAIAMIAQNSCFKTLSRMNMVAVSSIALARKMCLSMIWTVALSEVGVLRQQFQTIKASLITQDALLIKVGMGIIVITQPTSEYWNGCQRPMIGQPEFSLPCSYKTHNSVISLTPSKHFRTITIRTASSQHWYNSTLLST